MHGMENDDNFKGANKPDENKNKGKNDKNKKRLAFSVVALLAVGSVVYAITGSDDNKKPNSTDKTQTEEVEVIIGGVESIPTPPETEANYKFPLEIMRNQTIINEFSELESDFVYDGGFDGKYRTITIEEGQTVWAEAINPVKNEMGIPAHEGEWKIAEDMYGQEHGFSLDAMTIIKAMNPYVDLEKVAAGQEIRIPEKRTDIDDLFAKVKSENSDKTTGEVKELQKKALLDYYADQEYRKKLKELQEVGISERDLMLDTVDKYRNEAREAAKARMRQDQAWYSYGNID